MTDVGYLKITVTVILAVTGWIIAYFVTNRKSVLDKRRELVVEHLVETYRTLTVDIFARPSNKDVDLMLEKIISNIQLFGTPSQIKLVEDLVDNFSSGKTVLSDNGITKEHVSIYLPLINSLREELRKELNLDTVESPFMMVRSEYYCAKESPHKK